MSTSPFDATELFKHLDRWVDEELISRAEADAILRFEVRHEVRPHRISLVTEAIGYVGAALLMAAGITLASRFWDDADELSRITILAILTAILIGLGWGLRASLEPAIGRLSGVLWVLGTVTAAGLAGVIATDVAGAEGRVPGLASALAATVVATPLYIARRSALQHLALFVSGLFVVAMSFAETDAQGPAMWLYSAAWLAAGWKHLLEPQQTASVAGAFGMLAGAEALASVNRAGLWLGLATAVVLLAASVMSRERVLLGFGVVGLFLFLLRTIQEYFGGGGMVAGLAVAGVVVLVVALMIARRTARQQMGGGGKPRPAV